MFQTNVLFVRPHFHRLFGLLRLEFEFEQIQAIPSDVGGGLVRVTLNDLIQGLRSGVKAGPVMNLQIGQQVQPMDDLLGGLIRLINELLQLIGCQIKPLEVAGVDHGEFLAGFSVLRVLGEVTHVFLRLLGWVTAGWREV